MLLRAANGGLVVFDGKAFDAPEPAAPVEEIEPVIRQEDFSWRRHETNDGQAAESVGNG